MAVRTPLVVLGRSLHRSFALVATHDSPWALLNLASGHRIDRGCSVAHLHQDRNLCAAN